MNTLFQLPTEAPSALQAARLRVQQAEGKRDAAIAELTKEWATHFPIIHAELKSAKSALSIAEQSELNRQISSRS